VCGIVIVSFAYWAITNFVAANLQKWVFLLLGFVAVVVFVYLILGLTNGSSPSLNLHR
jgi:hypothetical protein